MAVIGEFGGQSIRLDNAATEETLQRLVDISSRGFGTVGNNLQTAANDAKKLGDSANKTGRDLENLGDKAGGAGDSFRQATQAGINFAQNVDRSSTRFARGLRSIGNSPFMVADAMTDLITALPKGSLSSILAKTITGGVAGAFLTAGKAIEGAGVGAALGFGAAVAPELLSFFAGIFTKVLKDTTDNFINLQKNGAILGGSLLQARLAAHGAGLTLGQFTNVMGKASEAMSVFGGQTLRGAVEFGELNKAVVQGKTGETLRRLGIGFEDAGIRTAELIAHLAESGISFQANAVSVAQARDRVVELAKQQKALAALNGTTIEQEKEKQRMARKDAQLNAIMLGMGEKEREGIQQLTSQFPQFSQFIKETVAFGGPVSKGALMQQAQMGATTEALGNTIQQVLAGGGQGAIDAFKALQDSSPALQADLANQAELVKLSLVSQNKFIQTAQDNFQSQFEIFTKANQKIVDDIIEDFDRINAGSDGLTDTIITLQGETQQITVELTKLATEAVSQAGAINNLIVGTTQKLNQALQNINSGIPGGISVVQPGQIIPDPQGTTTTAAAAAATAGQTGTTTTGPVTVQDSGLANLVQQLVDYSKSNQSSLRQIATNTQ